MAAPKLSKKAAKKVKDKKEEAAKNWPNEHVQQMIAMKGKMEPKFLKDAQKQGNVLC